jgi:hypothetical protein
MNGRRRCASPRNSPCSIHSLAGGTQLPLDKRSARRRASPSHTCAVSATAWQDELVLAIPTGAAARVRSGSDSIPAARGGNCVGRYVIAMASAAATVPPQRHCTCTTSSLGPRIQISGSTSTTWFCFAGTATTTHTERRPVISREAYVNDSDFTLYDGDVIDVLRDMPDESVHTVVTSPPYW